MVRSVFFILELFSHFRMKFTKVLCSRARKMLSRAVRSACKTTGHMVSRDVLMLISCPNFCIPCIDYSLETRMFLFIGSGLIRGFS